MKQILRTIDGWRFEAPLALALGAAACFAVVAMPQPTFGHVPVAGGLGAAGRLLLAVAAALLLGGIGYLAMRQAGKPKVAKVAPEFVDEDHDPEPVSAERLARFRRADSHPDAPPREPIVASRDLGTPFMEAPVFEPAQRSWEPPLVPEADFSEIEQPAADALIQVEREALDGADAEPAYDLPSFLTQPIAVHPAETLELADAVETVEPAAAEPEAVDAIDGVEPAAVAEPLIEDQAFEAPVIAAPVIETAVAPALTIVPPAPPRPGRESLGAMMDRLATGLQRRAAEPPAMPVGAVGRDMRPALREALDELNRLASRRH